MAGNGAGALGQIHRLWKLGSLAGLTDVQLLARFADRHQDGAELAFEALVERHGPMVFRICRGILGDVHAAEDAFQATFLVLAKKARGLWVQDSLASWLHGVAHRVAARARVDAARRRRHEQQRAEARGPALVAMPDDSGSDAWGILSEEIARLPATYRAPVVLCYLEAMSYQAAAASLGVTEDTVRGRLARARERLRKSLARRGVEVPSVVAVTRPVIPPVVVRSGLVLATARAATTLSVGGTASVGGFSRSVISLYERACRTMILTKLKLAAAALVLGVVMAGTIVSAQQPRTDRAESSGPATAETRRSKDVAAKGGNFIVDWIPADGKSGKRQISVDPTRHCIQLPWMSVKQEKRPNDGAVRVDLERGKAYKITAAGAAFTSEQTGTEADPFQGVVVVYPTDEEDCFAIRQVVLSPGKSVAFRTPWLIDPKDEVFLLAFFLDTHTGPNHGSYTLTIEETNKPAVVRERIINGPAYGIINERGIMFFEKARGEASK